MMRISIAGLVLFFAFLVAGCGGGSSGGDKQSGGDPPPTGEPLVRLLDEHEMSAVTDQDGRATVDVLSFDRPVVAVLEDENGEPLANWIVEYTQRSGVVETKSWDPTGDLLPLYYSIDLNEFVFDPETGEALGSVDLARLGDNQSIPYLGQRELVMQPSLEPISTTAAVIFIGKAAFGAWKTFKVASVGASLIAGGYRLGHFAWETNVSYSLEEGLNFETTYGNIRNNGIPAAINLAGGYFAAKNMIAKGANALSFTGVEVAGDVLNTIEDKVALDIIDQLLPGITDDETIIRFTVTTVSDTNLANRMRWPIIAVEVVGSTDPIYSHENFTVTNESYSESDNNDQACKNEFGSNYRLADWNDVVSYYQSGASMNDFFVNLGMPASGSEGSRSLMVSRNGAELYSSTRHYFISRHDYNKPGNYLAHDNIDSHLISLGSWDGSRPALCYKEDTSGGIGSVSGYCGLGELVEHEPGYAYCDGVGEGVTAQTLEEYSSDTHCGGYYKTRGYFDSNGNIVGVTISNGACEASATRFRHNPPESIEDHCKKYGGTGNYLWIYSKTIMSFGYMSAGVSCEF